MYGLDTIYKYMDFKSLYRLFCTEQIRMSTPNSLNDIFELPLLYNHKTPLQNAYNRIESEKSVAVTCYTETPTNLLMWSHYADHHKGVVVGFNCTHLFFRNLVRVRYVEKFTDSGTEVWRAIAQKGNDWIYEKEWRQLWDDPAATCDEAIVGETIEDDCYLKSIPMDCITQLIYGVKYWGNSNIVQSDLNHYLTKPTKFVEYLNEIDDPEKKSHVEVLSVYIKEKLPEIKVKGAHRSHQKYELDILDTN